MVRRASPSPPSRAQTWLVGQDAAAVPEEDLYRENTDGGRSIVQAMPNQLLSRPPRPPSPLSSQTVKRAMRQSTAVERAVADHAAPTRNTPSLPVMPTTSQNPLLQPPRQLPVNAFTAVAFAAAVKASVCVSTQVTLMSTVESQMWCCCSHQDNSAL